MITVDTYHKDIDVLRSKVGTLQKDLSDVIGAVGALTGHGLEDLREEAAAGAGALGAQSRQARARVYRGAADIEATLEHAIRQQPLLAVAIAAGGIGLVASMMMARRH
ncbi:DUF883 family protein [Arsenicitalea aurantiaca]|uniref:DUF883 family protein n=1 Tax=Arsenicitalea aurantiaca TaxID=1783274 RepID=A0A433XBF2_9HYPH|nr:DUF883 family protein [Arsenicitalea aurantiaca]RUT31427.1 DUF883 family protein [Arsenicitalea aurantiaca]